MRQHTIIGERILFAAPALAQVAALVRASHESYDGSRYPDGLAGGEIPIGARIIATCEPSRRLPSTARTAGVAARRRRSANCGVAPEPSSSPT